MFRSLCLGFCCLLTAGATAAEPNKGDELYSRIVELYMDGDFEELTTELKNASTKLNTMGPTQRLDVVYIRSALTECYPPWWKQAKAGRDMNIQQTVFNQKLQMYFDPNAKPGVNMNQTGADRRITIAWNFEEMDDPKHAEHTYTKGDLANLGVWQGMGMARVWQNVPLTIFMNPSEADKKRLQFFCDYWGDMTALYYCAPPARQWTLWLCLAAYEEKYRKSPTSGPRRVAAELFLAEVLGSPDDFPSLQLPTKPLGEPLTDKLALHFKNQLARKKHWTPAEDKKLRLAVKNFVVTNERLVTESGRVKLPNGLQAALDPGTDDTFKPRREEWLATRLAKAAGK